MADTINATSINENPLCARLQKRFAGRGAASAGTKAVNKAYTSVRDSKVARAADPFEETAEFVRAGGTAKTTVAYKNESGAAKKATAYNNSAFEETTAFNRATYKKAYDRAAGIRAKAADFNASTRQMPRAKAVPKAKPNYMEAIKTFIFGEAVEEKKIKSTPISKGLVLSAIVIALIVVLMLFSIAQINEFKNEISGLELQKQELITRIDDLNVAIDSKNDIRMIEDEATNRIGMVKSSQVETVYITLTEGERIEVVDASAQSAEEGYGVFGNLMSIVGTNWDHFMEYIN